MNTLVEKTRKAFFVDNRFHVILPDGGMSSSWRHLALRRKDYGIINP